MMMFQRPLVWLMAVGVVASCGDPTGTKPSVITRIDIVPGTASLYTGDTASFSAKLTFSGATPDTQPTIHWSSNNPAYLSIDASGRAKALSSAGTGLSVQAEAEGVSGYAQVTIAPGPLLSIAPTPSVIFSGMTRTLVAYQDIGSSYKNYVAIQPTAWASDNPAVLTVDASGTITALSPGHATVSAVYFTLGRNWTIQSAVDVLAAPAFQLAATTGAPFDEWDDIGGFPSRQDRNCVLNSVDGGVYCWGLLADPPDTYDGCEFAYTQGHYLEKKCSTVPLRMPSTASFTSLSSGGRGGCAISTSKTVYCFGVNAAGELGVGPTESIGAFTWVDHGMTAINSTDQFRAIFAMGNQRCGIRVDDVGVCWGIGIGTTPTAISGFHWLTMAPHSYGSANCGITTDSLAYCWSGAPNPKLIDSTSHWRSVEVGYPVACALSGAGSIGCWDYGATTSTVQTVAGQSFVAITSMTQPSAHGDDRMRTCGLTAAGDLYCVSVGGTIGARTYSLVQLDVGVKLKSLSGQCGFGVDNKAYCWNYTTFKATLVAGQ